MPPATAAVATLAAALSIQAVAAYVQTPSSGDGWFDGRATFFGAPAEFANAFKDRGEGAFGDLLWGSCGYFNKPQVRIEEAGVGGRGRAGARCTAPIALAEEARAAPEVSRSPRFFGAHGVFWALSGRPAHPSRVNKASA